MRPKAWSAIITVGLSTPSNITLLRVSRINSKTSLDSYIAKQKSTGNVQLSLSTPTTIINVNPALLVLKVPSISIRNPAL